MNTEETVKKMMDEAYNLAIDHAIKTAKLILTGNDLAVLVAELNKHKTQQHETPQTNP